MCHVGTSNEVPMLVGYQWADELEVITSMSKIEAENAFNITIANFSICSKSKDEINSKVGASNDSELSI
jgi:hypothetical protein